MLYLGATYKLMMHQWSQAGMTRGHRLWTKRNLKGHLIQTTPSFWEGGNSGPGRSNDFLKVIELVFKFIASLPLPGPGLPLLGGKKSQLFLLVALPLRTGGDAAVRGDLSPWPPHSTLGGQGRRGPAGSRAWGGVPGRRLPGK